MKFVVAHAGRRDGYQVARSLFESGELETLVTTGYYDCQSPLHNLMTKISAFQELVCRRKCDHLAGAAVSSTGFHDVLLRGTNRLFGSGYASAAVVLQAYKSVGRRAATIALARNAGIVIYNYCAPFAFCRLSDSCQPKLIFQCHPHPRTCRNILEREMGKLPKWRRNILNEAEFLFGERYFAGMCTAIELADGVICPSLFVKKSLLENRVPEEKIRVVNYGSPEVEIPIPRVQRDGAKIQLLYVGQFSQRKGLQYLFEAFERLDSAKYHLRIISRPKVSAPVSVPMGVTIDYDVSYPELVRAYDEADIFVFPSILEGWGLVITEAMARGLPVICTERTCGGDILQDGHNGLLIEAGDSNLLVGAISKLAENPGFRERIGRNAAETAKNLTWSRFRDALRAAVHFFVGGHKFINRLGC